MAEGAGPGSETPPGRARRTRRRSPRPPDPMRLQFKPEGWFGQRVRVRLGHGPPVAHLGFATWRTRVAVELPTATLDLRRDPADGALVLYRGDLPEAQAVKEGLFSTAYALEWAGGRGRLRSASGWGTRYALDVDGAEVARLKRSAWGGSRAEGTFPPDWPLDRALFVAAVALLAWREAEGAAGA